MQIEEIKDQICDVCHKMWQLGWVAANDGNVSVRLEDGTFLATPTGMSKSFITPDKLLRIFNSTRFFVAVVHHQYSHRRKNDGSTEMIKRNDGISEDDICQNQCATLVRA